LRPGTEEIIECGGMGKMRVAWGIVHAGGSRDREDRSSHVGGGGRCKAEHVDGYVISKVFEYFEWRRLD
jgi:hypothetical protein